MKKIIGVFGLFIITALLSSCGSKDDGGQANLACPIGSTYYNGACYNGAGGFVAGAGYTYSNGFYADNYSGTTSLRVTNGSKMLEFLRNGMGVCDRAGGSNYGQASCQSYLSGKMDIIIQLPTTGQNTLLATFIAQPQYNPYFNYSAQLPSARGWLGLALGWATGIYLPDPKQYYGGYYPIYQVELQTSLINNSAGFSANGYGKYDTGSFRTKLTIEVPQGKSQDYQLPFVFKVQDVPTAQGVMSRCRTPNCGL